MKNIIFFCCVIFCVNTSAQNLTLKDLQSICSKTNWEYANQYLINKGWEYYNSKKGSTEKYNTITWSYQKSSYDDKAVAWFYLYTYEGLPNKISFAVFNKTSYQKIQRSLSTYGYKLVENSIEDEAIVNNYANSKYMLRITTEKRTMDDNYSLSDESFTAYRFLLIKKNSVYDSDNGNKQQFFDNSNQVKVSYHLKNGKFDGLYKGYHENGVLKIEGNYKHDKKTGLWKEYEENGDLYATYMMKNGNLEGIAKIYENGKLKNENSFSNDKQHGISKSYYYDEDGELQAIEIFSFENGVSHGTDQFIYIDDERDERVLSYINYVEGLKSGDFQKFNGDSLIIGNYKNDKLDGTYKIYIDAKRMLVGGVINTDTTQLVINTIGTYKNDLKSGYWKFYDITGAVIEEGNYVDDLKSGVWKDYYSNYLNSKTGDLEDYANELYLEATYTKGMKNGKQIRYSVLQQKEIDCDSPNSNSDESCSELIYKQKNITSNYKNDKLHGLYTSRDSLGQVIFEGYYKENKKTGQWLESYLKHDTNQEPYYSYQEGNYVDDDRDGEWIQYFEKGKILIKCNYKYDQLHGDFWSYNDNGILEELKTFNYNKLTSLNLYDDQGQSVTRSYKISDETTNKMKVRFTNYFENGGKMVLDYRIVKPEKEIDHFDFKSVFHNQLQIDDNHYQDGDVLLTNPDGSTSIKGYMYKNAKTGTWEHYYPKQNVKIITTYIDHSNNPNSEIYYTIDTDQLFDGDFIYTDAETKATEERRIRDGLRNGNTIYFNKSGDKVKKEKYKDGILKD